MIKEILENIGLDKKEIEMYLVLVKLGKSTATQIGEELKIPRQTVYYIVDHIVEKGVIDQTDENGVRKYIANPYKLEELLESKQKNLEKSKESLKIEIPKLITEKHVGLELPKVEYYQGREGLERLFNSILKIHKQTEEKEFAGYGINHFYPGMEEFLKNFFEERYELGVKTRLFIGEGIDNDNLDIQNNPLGREYKKLGLGEQKAGIYLVGNNIFMFSYKDNVGIRVENKTIAVLLKAIFENDWKTHSS